MCMFLRETKAGLIHPLPTLLKNHCSRRAVPGEMPSGLFRSADFQRNIIEAISPLPGSSGMQGVVKPHLTIPPLAGNLGGTKAGTAE